MSTARIIPFPAADLPSALDAFANAPRDAAQPVTTVVITPAQGEGWVPSLRLRYPAASASFDRWVAAEPVGADQIVR